MKRLVDILGSLAGLILLSPLILVVALLVRFKLGSPIFYRQNRPGLRGEPFKLVKFRTMIDAVDAQGRKIEEPTNDDDRVPPLGEWLRAKSLDELPTLWNVLKGEMSLVGPRPLRMMYLDHYTPEEMRRHDVLPGVTGWAQVNGRNALTWEEKFKLDVWYVDHRSLWLDLKIMTMTVLKILRSDGINAEGHETMPRFERGSE